MKWNVDYRSKENKTKFYPVFRWVFLHIVRARRPVTCLQRQASEPSDDVRVVWWGLGRRLLRQKHGRAILRPNGRLQVPGWKGRRRFYLSQSCLRWNHLFPLKADFLFANAKSYRLQAFDISSSYLSHVYILSTLQPCAVFRCDKAPL